MSTFEVLVLRALYILIRVTLESTGRIPTRPNMPQVADEWSYDAENYSHLRFRNGPGMF